MYDNYPNPFNPETVIEYELPNAGSVRLEVYNMLGQKIRTLVNQNQVAGVHHVAWDGKNEFGEQMASGIYLYRMEMNEFKATKRMLLIR
ncbi:MAG TPA: T9SS type A sorting domain-containing protein [bacterium]